MPHWIACPNWFSVLSCWPLKVTSVESTACFFMGTHFCLQCTQQTWPWGSCSEGWVFWWLKFPFSSLIWGVFFQAYLMSLHLLLKLSYEVTRPQCLPSSVCEKQQLFTTQHIISSLSPQESNILHEWCSWTLPDSATSLPDTPWSCGTCKQAVLWWFLRNTMATSTTLLFCLYSCCYIRQMVF